MSARKKVRILERRLEYLQDRIDNEVGSPPALQWMKAEVAALEWALEIVYTNTELDLREEANGDSDTSRRRWWQNLSV